MTDQGNEQTRGPFSWLRDLLRLNQQRPPIVSRGRDLELENLQMQIEVIEHAFDEKIKASWRRDRTLEYLYHPERALMRRDDVEQVQRFFADRPDVYRGSGDSLGEPVDGVVLYLVPPRHDDGEVHLLEDLEELDSEIRVGVATPDHILYVVPVPGKACPASEPDLPTSNAPVPALNRNANAGEDVRVSVVDTGWYPPAAQDSDSTWLQKGVEGDAEPWIGTGQQIPQYGGHGTFVAGVVRCMAPMTEVEIEGFLSKGGAIWESDITAQLNQAMTDYEDNPRTARVDPRPPDLISISAGTHTRKELGLIGFEVLSVLYKLVDGERAPLVVAAAGNDESHVPFYPAAFDWVLSVGSLDADGKRSKFSNYGPWVDVYAQGSELVNAFPSGDYTYKEPLSGSKLNTTVTFTGMAKWSGTSFATPVVTGAIAAYMSENPGTTARQARDALIAGAAIKQDQLAGNMKALGPPFI